MRILVLSAYDADSHVRLRAGLQTLLPALGAGAEITTVALPPRHFAWRAGGNALAFAARAPRASFDVLLAMGPVDLSALLGLRPDLAIARRLLYVHEHEFDYPHNPREQGRVDRQMRQILALLAAQRVLVNSRYCGASLCTGIASLLARMPDAVPVGVAEQIGARIAIEPVPLEDALFGVPRSRRPDGELRIVWNHRHEWDKGPDRLPLVLANLRERGVRFRLHLLGQRFRRRPGALIEVENFLRAHPEHRGVTEYVDDLGAYRALLADSDLVLSTALQEFQGLAVMEAVALGCIPCVPDRLAYRDWVPATMRTPSHAADPHADARALAERIAAWARDGLPAAAPDLQHLALARRREGWRAHLASAADAPAPGVDPLYPARTP